MVMKCFDSAFNFLSLLGLFFLKKTNKNKTFLNFEHFVIVFSVFAQNLKGSPENAVMFSLSLFSLASGRFQFRDSLSLNIYLFARELWQCGV